MIYIQKSVATNVLSDEQIQFISAIELANKYGNTAAGDRIDGVYEGDGEGDFFWNVELNYNNLQGIVVDFNAVSPDDYIYQIHDYSYNWESDIGSQFSAKYPDLSLDNRSALVEYYSDMHEYFSNAAYSDYMKLLGGESAAGWDVTYVSDEYDGGGGITTVNGTDTADKLAAEPSGSYVYGYAGNDIISGQSGNDILIGGAGRDVIKGGKGRDTFVFDNIPSSSADCDKILDFTVRDGDMLSFDISTFTSLEGGIESSNICISSKAIAKDEDDYLIYSTKGSKLYYDADGNGSIYTAIQIAGIKGNFSKLDYTNFSVFQA